MSLLGNRNNDFEKKLKKQLGDTELKPSESLWDRIDKEVNRPEFEQKVEGKIGKYEVKPKPETWTYIEEQLPPEPSRWKRAGKLWYGVAILLFFGGAFAGYQLSNLPDGETANVPAVTIESARQGSQEIKEIVGGTGQRSEAIADEDLDAGSENATSADKIAVEEKEKSTSTGSSIPSVANETKGTTSGPAPAVKISATGRASAQVAHSENERSGVQDATVNTGMGIGTKQKAPVKPALSQHESNSIRHNQVLPAREAIVSNSKKRGPEPLAEANTALKPAIAVANSSPQNTSGEKTSDNNALLAQANERFTVNPANNSNEKENTGHIEVDAAAKQSKSNNPGKPATGQEPGSLNSSIAPAPENKESQPTGFGISDQTVAPGTSPSAGMPGDTSKVADKPAVSGKPLQALNDSMIGAIPADFNQIETQAPTRLSITIMAGVHQSYMKLVAPDHKNMDENVALRKQTEMPKMDFSGGFLVDYEASPRVLISSGIIFTGFSMSMKYNITPASKEASPEPGATYTNASDSIEQGSGMNNRIHYSWNEIPLFVTFRLNNPSKRFGLETRTGVSYAMLNAVDAAMVGQENIGVLLLKNKESFPHMKNSFFVHLYAGVSYQVNESVAIQLMPYFRYSLSNMIDNENWVKQYPWMVGVNFGLRKSF